MEAEQPYFPEQTRCKYRDICYSKGCVMHNLIINERRQNTDKTILDVILANPIVPDCVYFRVVTRAIEKRIDTRGTGPTSDTLISPSD
jgi:hypothetical protein